MWYESGLHSQYAEESGHRVQSLRLGGVPPRVSHMTTIQITTENTLCPSARLLGYLFPMQYPNRENRQGEGVMEPWGKSGQGRCLGSGVPCFRE